MGGLLEFSSMTAEGTEIELVLRRDQIVVSLRACLELDTDRDCR